MKKIISFALLMLFTFSAEATVIQPTHYISLLKEMFTQVTLDKNEKAIPNYYDKDFLLYSNGKTMDYGAFLKSHQEIFKTPIQYKIRYDENTLIEQGNRVAGRIFITTKIPQEPAHEIEVILIAEYKNNKLYRLYELTYPDWSKLPAFQNIQQH